MLMTDRRDMNYRTLCALAVIILSFLGPAEISSGQPGTMPATTQPANLLKNGSFEQVEAEKPADWAIDLESASHVQILAEGDNHFLRVTSGDEPATLACVQTIKIEPAWEILTVSGWMRAQKVVVGEQPWTTPRIAIEFLNEDGAHAGDWPEMPRLEADAAEWVEQSVTVLIPLDADRVEIRPGLIDCQGQVDFDDIQVQPSEQ
jgi:hypothetical protein